MAKKRKAPASEPEHPQQKKPDSNTYIDDGIIKDTETYTTRALGKKHGYDGKWVERNFLREGLRFCKRGNGRIVHGKIFNKFVEDNSYTWEEHKMMDKAKRELK